jgi:polysaccharide pyruvyl transferase WcaK-like protein
MVRHALGRSRLVHASVRDGASAERFRRHFGDLAPHPAVVRDPGLLASRFLGPAEAASGAVGLCVTSAVAVRYHSSLETSDEDLASFYTGLAERLRAAGRSLVAFTNGSPEDEAFLDALAPRLSGDGVTRRRVRTPAELARMIGSFDALVAHRMHALIAGHSFGVPIHALAWDCKVDAFMASVGAGAPTVADGASVEAVAARVLEPAAQAAPSAAVEEAAQHVARLFAALSESGDRRPQPAAGSAAAVAP